MNYKDLIEESNKNVKTADHLIYITYPLLKDPKLIITITERLYHSLMNAVSALLYYDYAYKRIDFVPHSDNDKIRLFKDLSMKTYNINKEIVVIMNELKEFIEFRKKSPLEPLFKDTRTIFSSAYNTRTLSLTKMKDYVKEVKRFNKNINGIIKNGL